MTLNRPQWYDALLPGTRFLVNLVFAAVIAALGECASIPLPAATANVPSPQRFEDLRTVAAPASTQSITEW